MIVMPVDGLERRAVSGLCGCPCGCPSNGRLCGWSTSAVVRDRLTVLLVVFGWLALASWWTPGGAWWPPLAFGACVVVCAGNLFWAVKNRRRPGDQ